VRGFVNPWAREIPYIVALQEIKLLVRDVKMEEEELDNLFFGVSIFQSVF
jgi:hypothetical protein